MAGQAAGHGNPFAQYRLGKLCLTGESVKKDVRKALEYLTAAARQGNPFAQYTLGKLYLLGRDVEQDREQARDWFTRSAAQGNAYAQFFLDRFDQFRDPSVMLAATKLLHHMSRIFRDNSMPPRNPAGIRIDSKRRKRLTEKRMAMGHKADDHEEQVSYQQTM
nr:tetratricopeptide repeat protein [Lawsonibacter hominis]